MEPHKLWSITSLKVAMAGIIHLIKTAKMSIEIMDEMVDIRKSVVHVMMTRMMTRRGLEALLQLMEIAIVSNSRIELKIWRRGLTS